LSLILLGACSASHGGMPPDSDGAGDGFDGPTAILSAPSSLAMGWSDARGFVTTDTDSGNIFTVVQAAATVAPSAAQIKTCKDGNGAKAAACTMTPVSSSGANGPIKLGCTQSTCLTSVTDYKVYFVHSTAGGD